jgi:hypothetical protein
MDSEDYNFEEAQAVQEARAKLVFKELISGFGCIARKRERDAHMSPLDRFVYNSLQNDRAKAVLDELTLGGEDVVTDQEFDSHIDRLNQLIRENLDADSLWNFAFLVSTSEGSVTVSEKVNDRISLMQSQKGKKRHAETNSMKAGVFIWLDDNMHKFKSMDAAAETIIRNEPIAFRTARDWVGEWKKLRSTGRP